ncbi:MAG: hypothetical protein COU63_00930 [Candidatus Pacebacteria bacterium CG10_big_fil_rev_8_21_14_0_10_36_11]|nr:DUF4012 domain-containing protein [Candidatus Pacearchaeota archaeon]OIP74583.1 MAG: hypothetical protein AUK08_00530 [Candidatus Pacebacteria bacterium CG2_30_36_39]PIR65210.1 MAG: hypothetical protein COU63_00930 [Candidatus Pacebacteria bacterium CG10_big_fil_rev_8_21_14_0_10_36_11]PJC42572.1 MAG: hypothetical protein CO040_03875 [Candidatus Pacebacteria bacterium CG_4_9_14_0_2_um_filter_36_8]
MTEQEPMVDVVSEPTAEEKKSLIAAIFAKKSHELKTENHEEIVELEKKPKKVQPWKKPLLIAASIVLSLILIIGIYTFVIIKQFKTQAETSMATAKQAYATFKAQDLPNTQKELATLQTGLTELQQTYQKLNFYRYVPIASWYYVDGEHVFKAGEAGLAAAQKAIAELVPYADVLGFQGEDSFTGGTAEDRIKILIDTLDKVMPSFDAITQDLKIAETELLAINPNHYPKTIKNQPIRSRITEIQTMFKDGVDGFIEFRPVLEQLPDLAGGKGERKKYLVLFQNDNELRPTGGFLTAYAVIYVENGKVTPEKSDDIYELDQKFTKRLPIPEALGKYLTTEKYWHLRDMNISPDFKLSMEQFYEQYKTVRGEPTDIDGIIAVDTKVLTDLLSVLGPVQVPAYGTFSAEPDNRCDGCAQVVYALSEIITKPTPYLREDRKGILGPLMQSTLQKAYSAPKEKWPELFQLMWGDLEGKHIQLYFTAEQAQTAAETVNAAGRMIAQENGNDFLAIINANLGGAKSNLFVNYDVKQEILIPESGMLEKSVEITYRNTRKADNCNLEAGKLCLNSTLRDWTRLYIPAGSELISAQGFTTEPVTYEENGMQVIDGFFILEPLGSAKLKLTYKVPYTDEKTYRIHLWKQGGVDDFETLFDVNGGEEKILVNKDSLVEIPF